MFYTYYLRNSVQIASISTKWEMKDAWISQSFPNPHSFVWLRSVSKLLEAEKHTVVILLGCYFINKASVITNYN